MSSKRKILMPDSAEDAEIDAGIAADADTRELTQAEFAQLRPLRPRGRPAGSGKKVQVTLRFDIEIVEAFRSEGAGWQTRMNDALKDWLATH